jgi:hypothetical protein
LSPTPSHQEDTNESPAEDESTTRDGVGKHILNEHAPASASPPRRSRQHGAPSPFLRIVGMSSVRRVTKPLGRAFYCVQVVVFVCVGSPVTVVVHVPTTPGADGGAAPTTVIDPLVHVSDMDVDVPSVAE